MSKYFVLSEVVLLGMQASMLRLIIINEPYLLSYCLNISSCTQAKYRLNHSSIRPNHHPYFHALHFLCIIKNCHYRTHIKNRSLHLLSQYCRGHTHSIILVETSFIHTTHSLGQFPCCDLNDSYICYITILSNTVIIDFVI